MAALGIFVLPAPARPSLDQILGSKCLAHMFLVWSAVSLQYLHHTCLNPGPCSLQ